MCVCVCVYTHTKYLFRHVYVWAYVNLMHTCILVCARTHAHTMLYLTTPFYTNTSSQRSLSSSINWQEQLQLIRPSQVKPYQKQFHFKSKYIVRSVAKHSSFEFLAWETINYKVFHNFLTQTVPLLNGKNIHSCTNKYTHTHTLIQTSTNKVLSKKT